MKNTYNSGGSGSVVVRCPVCTGASHISLRPYRGHSQIFGKVNLVRCADCQLVFVRPMPSEEDLYEYNSAYSDNAHGGLNLHPGALLFFSGMALLRLEHVLSYYPDGGANIKSVLEIGPGHGFFCEHVLRRSPACSYSVIESDHSCRERLRTLGATVYENLNKLDSWRGTFDLLVMSHVLEHSGDPFGFLDAAIGLLAPGGVVFIEVPCRDFEFKEEDEPHLVFFDKASLQRLFERLGLCNLRLSYHGKEIHRIKKESRISAFAARLARTVSRRTGMSLSRKPSFIEDPAIWDAVRPHEAHTERQQAAWWLRAVASKPQAGTLI
jgi:SAM-dependent methyltransferase